MISIRVLRVFVPFFSVLCCFPGLVFAQETITHGDVTYTQFNFSIPENIENIISVDLNSDGNKDMVAIHKDGLLVYLQDASQGFDFNSPSARIGVSADDGESSMGWDIVNFKQSGITESQPTLLALIDGKSIVTWSFNDSGVSEPRPVLSDLTSQPPKGLFRLNFANDINDDGYVDFIIPGSGELKLYLQQPEGKEQTVGDGAQTGWSFQRGISIQSAAYYQTRLNTSLELGPEVGHGIRIPLMGLKDVNSDGLNDLISETDERLDVFIGYVEAGVETYPSTPSYTLDIAAIEERLGEFSLDQLDFSNLTGALAQTHQEIMNDIDGDGIDDILIREGGKISLFAGTNEGMDFSQPRQVLKSSGNVLVAFVRDENEDELDDLWLIRVEAISIGDAFLWLALSGSVEVEAFIYRNDGTQFARRPARKLTLDVKFPSILGLMKVASNIEGELENPDELIRPSTFVDINQNTYDDLVVLLNERVDIFMDARESDVEPELSEEEQMEEVEQSILAFFDYQLDKDNYEVNIKEVIDKLVFNKNLNMDLVEGRQADFQVSLPLPAEAGDVFSIELNQDGIDDIVIFLERGDTDITGMLLLSQ